MLAVVHRAGKEMVQGRDGPAACRPPQRGQRVQGGGGSTSCSAWQVIRRPPGSPQFRPGGGGPATFAALAGTVANDSSAIGRKRRGVMAHLDPVGGPYPEARNG